MKLWDILKPNDNSIDINVTVERLQAEEGAVVLGVSKDSVESHKKFEETHGLPFTLLSDTELQVIGAYDVFRTGKDGKKTKAMIRTTYLIDENGNIEKAFGGVKPKENASQMLEVL